jgi:segregation and condensation protein A
MQENLQTNSQTKSAVSTFQIKTETFEGPLDLLLSLVEKRKFFINDVSLAKVADDYVAHISQLPEYSMGDRTQFILIASTLILIKARSLLPSIPLTEEEKESIEDLEARLRELELMRKMSNEINKIFGQSSLYFQQNAPQRIVFFAPGGDNNMQNIGEAINRVLNGLPKKELKLPEVRVQKTISLEDMMVNLTNRIKDAIKMSFSEFSRSSVGSRVGNAGSNGGTGGATGAGRVERADKVNVIVGFLAMLELVKQGTINANQNGLFDEIEMESYHVGTPKYL